MTINCECGAAPALGEADLVWNSGALYDSWDSISHNWMGSEGARAFSDGKSVKFGDRGSAYVELMTRLRPSSVLVSVTEGNSYSWVGLGSIAGEGPLVKEGEGTLTILTSQGGFSGEVYVVGGTLNAGISMALGTGTVWLEGGELSLQGCYVSNAIVVSAGSLAGAQSYSGELTVKGDLQLEGETQADVVNLLSGSIRGGSLKNTEVVASGGELATSMTGGVALTFRGDVSVTGANSYTGGSVLESGVVSVASDSALGTGLVRLNGGVLDAGERVLSNTVEVVGSAAVRRGEVCTGSLIVSGGSLTLDGDWGGELLLNGGTLQISRDDWGLTVGALSTGSEQTILDFGDLSGCGAGSSYTLVTLDTAGAGVDPGMLVLKGAEVLPKYTLSVQGNALVLTVLMREPAALVWDAGQETWGVQGAGDSWMSDSGSLAFMDGDSVRFDCSDEVYLVGEVCPSAVLVEGDGTVVLGGGGCIAGEGYLVKSGEGTLVLATPNRYAGGSFVEGGVLQLEDAQALGTGSVSLTGGTLDLGRLAVTNPICATGGTLAGADRYAGLMTVQGRVTLEGDVRAQGLTVSAGSLSGGCVLDTAVVVLGGSVSTALGGGCSLTIRDGEVSLTGSSSFSGGTRVESGCLTVGNAEALGTGEVALLDGELNLGGFAVANTVSVEKGTLSGAGAFAGELLVNGMLELGGVTRAGCVRMNGELLTGSRIEASRVVASSGTIVTVLAGSSSLEVTGAVTLSGTNSYTGGTRVSAGELVITRAQSLGSGTVTLVSGGIDMGGMAVENDVTAQGGFIRGASAYTGVLRVEGDVTVVDELRAGRLELCSGLLTGESVCDTRVEARGGTVTALITGGSSVYVYDGAELLGSNDYSGGTVVLAGELRVGSFDAMGDGGVILRGGTLNMGNLPVENALRAEGGTVAGAALYRGALEVDGEVTLDGELKAASLSMTGGMLQGGTIVYTDVMAGGGTLASSLGVGCSLTVTGDVYLSGANMMSADTVLQSGVLTAGVLSCFGAGSVLVEGGSLNLNALAVSNDVRVSGTAVVTGAAAASGQLEVSTGAALTLSGNWEGDLLLNGGSLDLRGNAFGTSVGSLSTGACATTVDFGDLSGLAAGDVCVLMQAASSSADLSLIDVLGTDVLPGYELEFSDGELRLRVDARGNVDLVWNPAMDIWGVGSAGDEWDADSAAEYFQQGNAVTFNQSDVVTLQGVLKPSVVRVTGDADLVLQGDGYLAGTGRLQMQGSGSLLLKTANVYSGGTLVQSGSVQLGCEGALGTGDVELQGGMLDLAGFRVENRLVVTGPAELCGADAFAGQFVLDGGALSGDVLTLEQDADVRSGSVSSELTGSGGVVKSTDGTVTLSSVNTYSGGTRVLDGTLVVANGIALGSGEVTVGGTVGGGEGRAVLRPVLDLQDLRVHNPVILGEGAELRNGSQAASVRLERGAGVTLTDYTLQSHGTLTVGGDNQVSGGLTFAGGTVKISGPGLVFTDACTVAENTTTILDLSAVAAEYNADGTHTLMVFEGGLSGMTEDSFALRGLDETFEKTLVYDEVTQSLQILTAAEQPLPPALDPEYTAVDTSRLNANQRRVYQCLDAIAGDSASDAALAALASQVTGDTDLDAVRKQLDELGGFALSALMRSRLQENLAHVRRLRNAMGSGSLLGGGESRVAAYAAAFGMVDEGSGGSLPEYSSNTLGAQLGLEYRAGERILLGLALEESWSELTPEHQMSTTSTSTSVDAYALVRGQRWESRSSLGLASHSTDSSRSVMGDLAEADGVSGFSVFFSQEVSWVMPLGERTSWQPYVAVDAGYCRLGSFSESSAGAAALRVDEQEAWAADITLGARFLHHFAALPQQTEATFSAFAGVLFSAGDAGGDLKLRFEGAPAHAFSVENDQDSRVGLTLGMGLSVPTGKQSELYVQCASLLKDSSRYVDCRVGMSKRF